MHKEEILPSSLKEETRKMTVEAKEQKKERKVAALESTTIKLSQVSLRQGASTSNTDW